MTARSILAALLLTLASSLLADNPPITVNVDAAASRHTIDSRIYGAAWATSAEITSLGLTLNRWGGNAMSRYNWVFDTANRCKDYYFFNIPNGGSNGASADTFISMTHSAGAEPVMTIPMLSLLPKDAVKRCSFPQSLYASQEEFSCCEPITCGNGRVQEGNGIVGDGPRILGAADPNSISTSYPLSHQGDWVQHMITTHAATGGVHYYSLDNEPGLWSFDHWDVHPSGTTYDEVWAKMSELGAIIRAKDASAVITGGEEWGWSGYFQSGLDMENGDGGDAAAHGGEAYYDWLLDQFHQYEIAHGTRILDVFTAHFYPQSGEFWSGDTSPTMQNLRNRSTRSLWDPNYVDESWIGDTEVGGAKVRLIPRLKEWVANHYPGTLVGITEYNWGDIDHINGATTQADILGIFGREALDVGVRWEAPGTNTFEGSAFRIYRNYDGSGAKFGDTSVSASGPNPDNVAVFASQRSSDNALTIMLIAKTLTGNTPATVNLAGFNYAGTVQRWQLTSASRNIAHLTDLAIATPSVPLTLPAQSITLLVIPQAVIPNPPTLTATASSTSQVALSWTAVAGAINYEVQRSFNNGGFSTLTTTAATSANDSALTANTSYLYKVRANLSGGGGSTAFSAIDPATTINFTDTPLNAGTPTKTTHFSQLRIAVNAMRASAGLAPQSFTDPTLTTSTLIKAVHLSELRTALDQARIAIGLSALSYTNPTITIGATTIKAAHINELRNGVK